MRPSNSPTEFEIIRISIELIRSASASARTSSDACDRLLPFLGEALVSDCLTAKGATFSTPAVEVGAFLLQAHLQAEFDKTVRPELTKLEQALHGVGIDTVL